MPEPIQVQKKLGGRTAIVGQNTRADLKRLIRCLEQVGTGSRGQLFLRGVVDRAHIPGNAVVALCDSNAGRVKLYNRLLQELGQPVSPADGIWTT